MNLRGWVLLLLMVSPVALWGQDAPGGAPAQAAPPAAAQPGPDSSGLYHGGKLSAPKITHAVEPQYTPNAQREKIEGVCGVTLIVDADGNPQKVHVTKSIAEGLSGKKRDAALELDDNAVATVKHYRFKPAKYQGKPVPVEIYVQVNYQLY
jgi:protein TonB